jgi:hypothetical protein
MRNSLRVCCDTIVLFCCEIDMLGSEAGHDVLHESKVGVRGTVVDQDERLSFRVYARSMERMHGDDADVPGKMSLESLHLRSFA